MSTRCGSASPWCAVFELYHGACVMTMTHGVFSRSIDSKSLTSHSYCHEPGCVAQYEQREMTWTGPTSLENQCGEVEPDALYGVGKRAS